jgi:hypothetical protein
VREGVIGGAHHRLSSFIIITHRSPSCTSGHQRRLTSISDHHRPVAPNGDRVRAPASALAFIISRHRQGASVIVAHPHRRHHPPQFRSRAVGTVVDHKQRSRAVIRHRGGSPFDGDHHGTHPSRRRCCAVTTAACADAELLCRVLFPALREAGAGKQNAVVVIVVRRYAGLAVVAGLGLLSSSIATMMAVGLTRLYFSHPFFIVAGDDDFGRKTWPITAIISSRFFRGALVVLAERSRDPAGRPLHGETFLDGLTAEECKEASPYIRPPPGAPRPPWPIPRPPKKRRKRDAS